MSILICYDGSASFKRSLAVAREVLDGPEAVLLYVWIPPDRILDDASGAERCDGQSYEQLVPSPSFSR